MEIPVAYERGGPGQATVTAQRAPGTEVRGVLRGCSLGMKEGAGLTPQGLKAENTGQDQVPGPL